MDNPYLINIHFLTDLGATLVVFLLAVFVLARNPYSPINKFFAAFALFVTLWTFGLSMEVIATDPKIADLWGNIGSIGAMMMGPLFLLFVLAFTRNHKWVNNFFVLTSLVGISIFFYSWFVFISPTPIESLYRTPWGWESHFPLTFMQVLGSIIWIPFLMLVGVIIGWQFYRKTKDAAEKKQAMLIIIAGVVPLILGTLSRSVAPYIDVEEWIVRGVKILFAFSSLVLVAPLAYAASKYKLFTRITPATAADVLIETMKDALIVVNTDLNIEFVNSFASELLGYRKDELMGRHLSHIFSQQEKGWGEFNEKAIPRIKRGKDVIDSESIFMTKDGELIPVSFSGSPFRDERGNITGIVGVARDIRETSELIERLNRTTEELRETKRELERKIGGLIKS